MADIIQLTSFINAYGTAVRAGVVTPCVEDENYIRQLMDLPDMPQSVRKEWESTGGIRKPITLVKPSEMSTDALQPAAIQEPEQDSDNGQPDQE